MKDFQESLLWKKNLADQGGQDPYKEARERLRRGFISTRSAVVPLVAQIGKELPGLTVHDITHLDHLWHIADTILGPNFSINPAETFVLGMTFLLHDAATSTYAFPNGIDDLLATEEWNDLVAQRGFLPSEMKQGEIGYKQALFETLRLLHPRQAETLLTQSWKDMNNSARWLLEDVELRNHYARVIGKISASHGKNITVAEEEWANAAPLTPHSCLELNAEANWKVDTFKIAMLLRCIDAAHIDSRRAPDMLAALTTPDGDSKNHWLFQNRLGDIGVNTKGELYWSGQAFEEKDADAWWLCYKTAQMIDREIRAANRLLENNGRQTLQAIGVMGALDLNVFQSNVPAQGWQPIDINFQVSQVSDVIEKFGGEKLYGPKPYLALRELIQNAADAIRATRAYRGKPEHGDISLSLFEDDNSWWLSIQDNGIGMSRYVLTDVLLDFGRSLWGSSTLREEWRGLAGKGFEPVGKFGIGFFSVFMLGDEIKITTWRNGDSESNQNTLHIRNRTNAKPILINTQPKDRIDEFGTRISIRLKNGRDTLLPKVPVGERFRLFDADRPKRELTLAELVGTLAPALDINVWCQDGTTSKSRVIQANDWKVLEPRELAQRLAPAYAESDLKLMIRNFHDITESDGRLVGRASLNGATSGGIGLDAGMLVYKGINVGRCNLCGILISENNQDLARNSAEPICSAEALQAWASKVMSNLEDYEITPWLTNKLLSLGVDSETMPLAKQDSEYVNSTEISSFAQANEDEEIVVVVETVDCPDDMAKSEFEDEFSYKSTIIRSEYIGQTREHFGMPDWIAKVLPNSTDHPRTVNAAINRAISNEWLNAELLEDSRVVGTVRYEEIKAKCIIFRKTSDQQA